MICKCWIGKDVEGSGRVLGICLERLRKSTKNLRIAGLLNETWNRDLPNTKQECLTLHHDDTCGDTQPEVFKAGTQMFLLLVHV
jgi:hypothetical protein